MATFQDLGIVISSSGIEVRTTCPQCSQNRKKKTDKCLAVNTVEECFFCHHCGWSGSLKEKTYKTFDLPSTKLSEKVIEWFESRGISEGILNQEHIGYDGKSIKFPYFYNSVCVNIKSRTHDKRFWQEKDGLKCLYRLDKIRISTKKTLVITEGEMDCLSLIEAGLEATSIPDGAPSANAKNFNSKFDFLKNAVGVFDKFEKIVLAGDNDDPGKRAIEELGRRIGYERCYVVKYPDGCKDINDVLKKHGKNEIKRVINSAKPYPVEGIISPNDCISDLLDEYENGIKGGESTGWKSLDNLYTARIGEMTVVTGMPGSGKSNFIDALCLNLAMAHHWRIGYFSPENWPVKRHIKTLLEKLVDKTFLPVTLENGTAMNRMTPVDIKEGTNWLDDHIRFILPKEEILTVEAILKYARILCLQYGIKGLVLDPWNEFEHTQKNGEREDQYISRQLTAIRRFARFNGIHIWIIAHPTKLHKNSDGKYDPPTLYEISGGANWRNKADNGMCVFRDYDTGLTKIIIQKIRFREIGQLGETTFRYTFSGNYKDVMI